MHLFDCMLPLAGVGVYFVKGMHFSQSKNARLLNL